jgi:hypothetical protein
LLFVLTTMTALAQQVTVSGNISTNTTWLSDTEYILDGLVFVDSTVTLTIEAGTVIKALQNANITSGDGASGLIIRRGAQIDAQGTADSPIVFTSELDDGTLEATDRGLWGGVIILGRATTNETSQNIQIEGIPSETPAEYGGTADDDNSGTLRYVSIRHGGFSISGVPGDEINGLTLGAVGSGTTIEYVDVFANFDDCYEWFGGTVNTRYLVGAFCGDDTFDYDQGFRGKGQFWFSIQATDEAGRAGEHDGGDTNETGNPFSIPVISNVTYIGSGATSSGIGGDGNDRAFAIRDNAGGKYYNSIFTDFAGVGVNIEDLDSGEDSRARLEAGDLVFANNLWFGFSAGNTAEAILPQDFVRNAFVGADNSIEDPSLRGISRTTDAGLDPRLALGSPATSNADFSYAALDDDFFTPTVYQGAFGGTNWLLGWTGLDENGFAGDIPLGTATNEVVVTNDITTDTDWTADNVYVLDGLVFVNDGATLSIQPGTTVKARFNTNISTGEGASALIIRRGGMITAQGTASAPIVFTSEFDDGTLTASDRGLWGGVIILGRATTNETSQNIQIEGIPSETPAEYGGTADDDNSGTLRYVSIRHGGFSISGVPGDEINGLTLGAVGSGTTIEYVDVFANFDDCYEWFGGTVNTRYLVGAFCGDDTFDYDQGFRGKGQFWFSIQATDEAGRAGEHDGGDTNETGNPFSIPVISNVTYIGSGATSSGIGGDGNDRAFAIRDNAGGKYYNSIFTDFAGVGVNIEDLDSGEDSRARLEAGDLVFANNLWFGFSAGNTAEAILPQDFVRNTFVAAGNQIVDPQITSISRAQDSGLNPIPTADVAFNSTRTDMNAMNAWFQNPSYHGAFDTDGSWINGWTGLSAYGILADGIPNPIEDEDAILSSLPSTIQLDQNYPNPFNPTTNINFALPTAQNITLKVYDMLGREVATLLNNQRISAGQQTISFDASGLSSGVYIYQLIGANTSITKRMTLIK